MEIVKYLCEFFFCHFWHFLELVLVFESIFGGIGTQLYVSLMEKINKEDKK